jgi:amino acid transporter
VNIAGRLGVAIAAGVPLLVLVSMGPVAGMAGPPSVLVWAASALIGLLMALCFAELAQSLPWHTGGIGVLSARVLAPYSRVLALLAQWSYWFGWSPALAVNGILVGTYLHDVFVPQAPAWTTVALAVGVLGASLVVNHLGIGLGARLQALIAAGVVTAVGLLAVGVIVHGRFDAAHLVPFAPPGGWISRQGLIALAGALFLAGWSAYGCELALTYGTEYRGGARDAVNALLFVAVASVVAYTAVPLLMLGVLGVHRIQDDPAVALTPLVQQVLGGAGQLVVGVLVLALLLGLNMVTIGSSRVLYQMSRNGDAWVFLGQLNRHGVPANALRFDMGLNVLLLIVSLALNGGRTGTIPVALLAAANVGYFATISLALIASWLNHRTLRRQRGVFRIRDGLSHLGLALAVLNLVLLAFAGFAWGWPNVLLGVLLLAVVMVASTRGSRRAAGALGVRPGVRCMAWGTNLRTATVAELRALQFDRRAEVDGGPPIEPASTAG